MLPRPGFRSPRSSRRSPPAPLGQPRKPPTPPSRAHKIAVGVTVGLLLVFSILGIQAITRLRSTPALPEVTLSGALTAMEEGKVARVHLDDGSRRATLILTNGTRVITAYPVGAGEDLTKRAIDNDVKLTASPESSGRSIWFTLVFNLLPVVLLIGFFILFMGPRMGMGKMGKSRRRPAEVPTTRFTDVVGMDEAVSELAEVVEFLHAPERFASAGARVPHGFLLIGPPGTGKTLLARAVAGEAGVPFFALSGSDFVETFVGVGASRVRQVFDAARKLGRAIVFIDEIDAVGKARTSGPSGGGAEERENTLNQLLVEMDGFTRSGIIVLAATNRSDVLDPALTRPGRFDRRVVVPAPDRVGRTKILELYARTRKFSPDVDFVGLGRRTPGLTGADLEFLVNEAALVAARRGSDMITGADLQDALATAVLGRERRSAVITDRDRRITAWHEAGHAVAALVLPHADDPVSVTIVPRGVAGGVTWMGGNDNSFLTRSEAQARLVVSMGGRAAEEVHLEGDFTQGAASDFASATHLAVAMVTEYGMSDLGVASRAALTPFGAHTDEVNTAVSAMLERALDTARQVVADNLALIKVIVAQLLIEETVTRDELVAMAISCGARAVEDAAVKAGREEAATARDQRRPLADYRAAAALASIDKPATPGP
ncbi:MAG: ATP-dependent metallopeptidase FtsH/Yme1/Tma family protein [Acidimicrobiales bacterium]